MFFNSVEYAIFFTLVFFVFHLLPAKIRPIWLLVASYFFYANWNIKYTLLIFFVTVVTFVSAILISKLKCKLRLKQNLTKRNLRLSKTVLIITMVLCFGLLIYYKYANFLLRNINFIIGKINSKTFSTLDIILPVGISFYIFQAVGYVIDVYNGKTKVEKNILIYSLFVSYFPQLVAGPIERSKNLIHQLKNPAKLTSERLREGLFLILFGLFQKVVIADRIANIVDPVFSDFCNYTGIEISIAVLLFGIQIYCDFAGYSNIAIGSSRLLGVDLMLNFNAPYLASSVVDFWRRWHISLTSWFTDYLYIPLGGNRKGRLRKYINTLIVFLVSGAWHGASWNFVFWGAINGIMNIISSIRKEKKVKYNYSIFDKVANIVGTFILIDFSWLFFRAESLSNAFAMIRKSVGYIGVGPFLRGDSLDKVFGNASNLLLIIVVVSILICFDVIQNKKKGLYEFIGKQKIIYRWIIYLTLISFIVLFGAYGEEYEQVNFIYFQF